MEFSEAANPYDAEHPVRQRLKELFEEILSQQDESFLVELEILSLSKTKLFEAPKNI